MTSYLLLGLCGFLLSCAVVDAQNAVDATRGAAYDDQVYVRGQTEGKYTVPGVAGSFQTSQSRGEYVYTDDQGNTYTHRRGNAGGSGSHSISGPALVAQNTNSKNAPQAQRRARSPQFHVARPDRTVDVGSDGSFVVQRRARSPQLHVSRPDRTVDVSNGGYIIQRQARSPQFHVARPDRTVDVDSDGSFVARRRVRSPQYQVVRQGETVYFEPGQDIHVSRPGHSVDISNGKILVQRQSRSPHHHPDHHEHPEEEDVHTEEHAEEHKRVRRARVQGENFVARDNQAGVWNDNVSVWKRPDGRTVTVDAQGNVITSGSPNGRGPQYYSGK